MTERRFARKATRSRGRLPVSVPGVWATIDAKLTPLGAGNFSGFTGRM
jgi:hypothetical protein